MKVEKLAGIGAIKRVEKHDFLEFELSFQVMRLSMISVAETLPYLLLLSQDFPSCENHKIGAEKC